MNSTKKRSKKIKWLKYFSENYNAHPTFVSEMDKQLRPQFENHFNRLLNWDRIWLFIEPIEGVMNNLERNGIKYTQLISFLDFESYILPSIIEWVSNDPSNHINIQDEISRNGVVFTLVEFEIIKEWMELFPGKNNHVVIHILPTNTYFKCFVEGNIAQDGYFDFKISNSVDPEYLEKIAEEGRSRWNDNRIELEGLSLDRGIMHNLYINGEGEEENSVRINYDSGSADYGIFKFLLEYIGERVEGIEQVVIRG